MKKSEEKDRKSGSYTISGTPGLTVLLKQANPYVRSLLTGQVGFDSIDGVENTIYRKGFFEYFLSVTTPIHYKKKAIKYTGEKSLGKMTEPIYALVCINHFLDLVRKGAQVDVRVKHGKIFVYNNLFWEEMDKEDVKDFLRKFAKKTGVPQTIEKVEFLKRLYETLLALAGIPPKPRATGTAKINLLDGTLTVEKEGVKMREHNPDDFLKHLLDYRYDPKAKCLKFDEFFDEILPDKRGQDLFFEHVAAAFFKHGHGLKLEKGLILYGKNGANGKSTLLDAIAETIGKENVSFETPDDLFNPSSYALPSIEGKLLNITSEITKTIDGSKMKKYLTGEPLPTRQIYGERYTLTDYPKMIISANELPRTTETGNSYYRRWHVLPFDVEIEKQDPDKLLEITEGQKPGILNHIIKAVERLNKNRRFSACKASDEAVQQYKSDGDTVLEFLEERGYKKGYLKKGDSEKSDSDSTWLKLDEIYTPYKTFCDAASYNACGRSNFRRRLDKAGYIIKRGIPYKAPDGNGDKRFFGYSVLANIGE